MIWDRFGRNQLMCLNRRTFLILLGCRPWVSKFFQALEQTFGSPLLNRIINPTSPFLVRLSSSTWQERNIFNSKRVLSLVDLKYRGKYIPESLVFPYWLNRGKAISFMSQIIFKGWVWILINQIHLRKYVIESLKGLKNVINF